MPRQEEHFHVSHRVHEVGRSLEVPDRLDALLLPLSRCARANTGSAEVSGRRFGGHGGQERDEGSFYQVN